MTAPAADRDFFRDLRDREFGRLDRAGVAYLDWTGSGLYGDSQIRRHMKLLQERVLGNPHSESEPSILAEELLEEARSRVLASVGGNEAEHVVCFTSNATGAMRLVGEAFPFEPGSVLALTVDNHNSVLGLREVAGRKGASLRVLSLDEELRLDRPRERLPAPPEGPAHLLAFPAQSNFTGVRHSLDLVARARDLGYRVLLDVAAYVPTSPLDLGAVPADFAAISFYKVFGYPTGLGALVARREALEELSRPWFSGGTVEFASFGARLHRLRDAPGAFEDGTPDFLAAAALALGYDLMDEVGQPRLGRRIAELTGSLLEGLQGLRHGGGGPMVRLYGPADTVARGGTVPFNVLRHDGSMVPHAQVVAWAGAAGVAIRGGCFCNPGAGEAAMGLAEPELTRCLTSFMEGPFSLEALSECVGGTQVGAVRASVGMATVEEDLQRLLELVERVASQEPAAGESVPEARGGSGP